MVISTQEALAWFTVCNQSSDKIYVAFGYLDAPDNRDVDYGSHPQSMSSTTGWVAAGWFNLNSGECTNPYPHELWRRNRYYYVYAETANGKTWGGNTYFCIDRHNRFSWGQRRDGSCEGVFRGFYKVDIGGGRVQNYTFTLRD